MRASRAFSRLLNLDGIWVRQVQFHADRVVVSVALRRRRLQCPLCEFSTRHRHNQQSVESSWRHLDLGVWCLELRAQLRRLECPEHGVRVEAVPFARHRSGFTRDFEQLVAWLARTMDKTAITRLVGIDWDTVGRIISRVCADELNPDRLENLFEIGIDEVSWKRQHNYLTLVADHLRGQIVWGTKGNDSVAANRFFRQIGKYRSQAIEVISLDMGPGYAKSARGTRRRRSSRSTPSTSSRWRTGRWMTSAARTETSCASSTTPRPPAGSRTPAGRCSKHPTGSTTSRLRR